MCNVENEIKIQIAGRYFHDLKSATLHTAMVIMKNLVKNKKM